MNETELNAYLKANNLRRSLIIDRQSQWLVMGFSALSASATLAAYLLISKAYSLLSLGEGVTWPEALLIGLCLFMPLAMIFLIFLASCILSNRLSGPVYAFHRNLRLLLDKGERVPLKLRDKDLFLFLAQDFNDLLSRLETAPGSSERLQVKVP